MTHKIFLTIDELSNLSVSDICNQIIDTEKINLESLRVYDLIESYQHGLHGVYLFFDETGKECFYVGKNSSQQFIERIPWHFAISEKSWMNHFLKYYKKNFGSDSLVNAAFCAKKCRLILLPIETLDIASLEKLFRIVFSPKFNALKSLKFISRKNHLMQTKLLKALAETAVI